MNIFVPTKTCSSLPGRPQLSSSRRRLVCSWLFLRRCQHFNKLMFKRFADKLFSSHLPFPPLPSCCFCFTDGMVLSPLLEMRSKMTILKTWNNPYTRLSSSLCAPQWYPRHWQYLGPATCQLFQLLGQVWLRRRDCTVTHGEWWSMTGNSLVCTSFLIDLESSPFKELREREDIPDSFEKWFSFLRFCYI